MERIARLVCVLAVVAPGRGFLPAKFLDQWGPILDPNKPEIKPCLKSVSENESLRTHWDITLQGVAGAILEYCREHPLYVGQSLDLPDRDYNFVDVWTAYNRMANTTAVSSPSKLMRAVMGLLAWNGASDAFPLSEVPSLHFHSERLEEGQQQLLRRYQEMFLSSLTKGEAWGMVEPLATVLHSVQDFYSHTNWVELGNVLLAELGFPENDWEGVGIAPNGQATCKDCSGEGECIDNFVDGLVNLTSGYLKGSVTEPPGGKPSGKCSFGGIMDGFGSVSPTGGMNKDTPTPCYSPHSSLHKAAADDAAQATRKYLKGLRTGIGEESFASLFDLHRSPTLAVVVRLDVDMKSLVDMIRTHLDDVTGTVQEPRYYVLTYFDKACAIHTKTTTSREEFLVALEAATEKCDNRLNLATAAIETLRLVPVGSPVFVITKKGYPSDPALVKDAYALAVAKRSKVHFVLVSTACDEMGLETLSLYTGGVAVCEGVLNNLGSPFLAALLSEQATLIKFKNKDEIKRTFSVDSSISTVEFLMSGTINSLDLKSSITRTDGIEIPFENLEGNNVPDGVELIAKSERWMHIKATVRGGVDHGTWEIYFRRMENKNILTLHVLAATPLDVAVQFSFNGETKYGIQGPQALLQPVAVTSDTKNLQVWGMGSFPWNYTIDDQATYATLHKEDWSNLDMLPVDASEQTFYVNRLEVTNQQAFFVEVKFQLKKKPRGGRELPLSVWRTLPGLYPAASSVGIFPIRGENSSSIPHGGSGTFKFRVVNFGAEAVKYDFNVRYYPNSATDGPSGNDINLEPEEEREIELTLTADPKWDVGTQSLVIATVISPPPQAGGDQYPLETVTMAVLPVVVTFPEGMEGLGEPPTCDVEMHFLDCENFLGEGNCEQRNWTSKVRAKDSDGDLIRIRVVSGGREEALFEGSYPGSREEDRDFRDSCCNSIGTFSCADLRGNTVQKEFNIAGEFGESRNATGMILGIVLGTILAVLLIGGVAWFVWYRKRVTKRKALAGRGDPDDD